MSSKDDYGQPCPADCVGEVKRQRRNDYVGPAIWGIDTSLPLKDGDRIYEDDALFKRRWYFIVGHDNGRLAAYYEDTRRFCGYINYRKY